MRANNVLRILAVIIAGVHGPTRDWIIRQYRTAGLIALNAILLAIIFIIVGVTNFWLAITVSLLPISIFVGLLLTGYLDTLNNSQRVIRIILFLLIPIVLIAMGPIIFTGVAFVLAIILFTVAYAPIGITKALFGHEPVPRIVKLIVGWLAVAGWVGMMYPTATNWVVVLILLFVGIITTVFSKTNIIEKVIVPVVIILTVSAGIREVFPDTYRASTRWMTSNGKMGVAYVDRQSLMSEGTTSSNFAKPIKDIFLYKIDKMRITNTGIIWSKDSILRVLSPKDTGITVNGLLFIKVQIPDENGSYIDGPEYWVEADLIDIASRRSLLSKSEELKDSEKELTQEPAVNPIKDYYAGDKPYFKLGAGELSQRIRVPANSLILVEVFSNGDYIIVPEDGSPAYVSHNGVPSIPKGKPFRLRAPDNKDVLVELVIT
jgi:hypothetical protein